MTVMLARHQTAPSAARAGVRFWFIMVRLKSRTQSPVNGFQFIDPAIAADAMQTWDFESLVAQVQARRAANPRFGLTTDANSIRQEVDAQNALRMLSIRNAESYVTVEGGPSPNRGASRSPSWAGAVGGVRKLAAGMGTLKDWLGSGGVAVPPPKSEGRAAVCVVCPQNQPGDILAMFTQPVAERIKAQLAIKNDLNLTTTYDDKLEVCQACACPLKLKVHTPLEHIAAHLPEAVKAQLDARCWILKEINEKG